MPAGIYRLTDRALEVISRGIPRWGRSSLRLLLGPPGRNPVSAQVDLRSTFTPPVPGSHLQRPAPPAVSVHGKQTNGSDAASPGRVRMVAFGYR